MKEVGFKLKLIEFGQCVHIEEAAYAKVQKNKCTWCIDPNGYKWKEAFKNIFIGDFPGGPVVKTTHFHCRGHVSHPWSGN